MLKITLTLAFLAAVCTLSCEAVAITVPPDVPTTPTLPEEPSTGTPATDEDGEPLCAYQADLAFIVDASSSIGDDDFEKMKTFIKGVIRIFDIANNKVRISMLKYNRGVDIRFNLNTYSTKDEIMQAVENTYGTATGTRTDLGLKRARARLFTELNGDRLSVPNIAILLTDGLSSIPHLTALEQRLLKDTHARVFVLGIGGKIDQTELDMIASMPTNVFSHKVANFDGLELVLEEFAKTTCYAITLPPYVPTTPTLPAEPSTEPSTTVTITELTTEPSTTATTLEVTTEPSTTVTITELTTEPSTTATTPEVTTEPPTTATLPEFTTEILCQDAGDVMIVMDASSSIGPTQFEKMKHFLMGLVAHFDVAQDRVRIGLIKYHKFARIEFQLDRYSNRVEVMHAINALEGTAVGTRTDHALLVTRRAYQAEKGDREGIPNVAILLTDGRSTYDTWTEREAKLTKESGVKIFAIGIGGRIDVDEINMIASGPSYAHMVADFDGLNAILAEFAKTACSGVQGNITVGV